jgi:hypothetical protein
MKITRDLNNFIKIKRKPLIKRINDKDDKEINKENVNKIDKKA